MSDALALPPSPDPDQYEQLARDLAAGGRAAGWPDTQDAEWMEKRWQEFRQTKDCGADCTPADAQGFVARAHGFANWPKFADHLEALARVDSPVSRFETAVDAIVGGNAATIEQLLNEYPELVRERSAREHRSTLLHYVSANGVEDFRQKTPKNIIEIARLLLQAGADVNAESDAYGGRSTALGLTATSCHPEEAGVQLALMELLMDHGATVEGPDGGAVNGCLGNGRGPAAELLASRGARLDLEGAAGVGRLDVVKSFFEEDGRLKLPATPQQMLDGFAWACEFGRTSVVDFLLQRGVEATAKLRHHGQIGLHWAAYGGHSGAAKLLIDRGSPIDAKDDVYGGTPLEWALYAWGNSKESASGYYEVVTLLVAAGAKLDPQWFEDAENRRPAVWKVRADPRMLAALGCEIVAE